MRKSHYERNKHKLHEYTVILIFYSEGLLSHVDYTLC